MQHIDIPLRTSPQELFAEIERLGPWFHNIHLPDGTQTAPDSPLGDFPRRFWIEIAPYVPESLAGWTVLDVGCNAGFYTFELARRGATVTAIDLDPHYLRQARWAAGLFRLEEKIEFRQMQVYDLARIDQQYDLVWYMGVLYHLRYPLLSLDILSRKTRRLMVFQTMTMPGDESFATPPDLGLDQRAAMLHPGWPKMAFIEHRVAGDPTNWWASNSACVQAMLRSCGLQVLARPLRETYLCEPATGGLPELQELNEAEYRSALGLTAAFGKR